MLNNIKEIFHKIRSILEKKQEKSSNEQTNVISISEDKNNKSNSEIIDDNILLSYINNPPKRQKRLYEKSGLIITISSKGNVSFSVRLMLNGERHQSIIGYYPNQSLENAKKICLDLKKQNLSKKILKKVPTISSLYLELQNRSDYKPNTIKNNMSIFRKYIDPLFGNLLVIQISNYIIMEKLGEIKSDSRKKIVLIYLNKVLDYAVLLGFISSNPASNLWKLFYRKENNKIKHKHFPSIHYTKISKLNVLFIRKNNQKYHQSQYVVALLLFSLCRVNEILALKWQYIDYENKVILLPANVMKTGNEHKIPITKQIFTILKLLECNCDMRNNCEYVFPNLGMTKDLIGKSKNKLGNNGNFHQTSRPIHKLFFECGLKGVVVPHGFRSIGRTWMEDQSVKESVAEMCLAHSLKTTTEKAYNRTDYLDERRTVLQQWNDFIEKEVISIKNLLEDKIIL